MCLQGHVDMVCEKNEGTAARLHEGPDRRVPRRRRACARAGRRSARTTASASPPALAALASDDVRHGPLEVLVTVDEETGLTGAKGIAPGWLRARYLLNLDSEEEGELTIGCAGGVDTVATRKVALVAPPAGTVPLRLKVSGLKGGHSGDRHRRRPRQLAPDPRPGARRARRAARARDSRR